MQQATDGRSGSVSSWSRVPVLSVVLLVGVFLILLDLAWGGFLLDVDLWASQLWDYHGPNSMPLADIFDKIGQRTTLLPILFFVAYRLSRELGSIRPLVISVAGSLLLNFVVGVIKLTTARESPRTGGPELFVGSNLFPSGHTSNIVMMLGLTVALIFRYGRPTSREKTLMVLGVAATFVFMVGLSIYRHTHWFTDLIAGGMIGVAVLELCTRADTFWPTVRSGLKRVAGPAWPSVEQLTARVRPVILRTKPEPSDQAEAREGAARGNRPEPVRDVEPSRSVEPSSGSTEPSGSSGTVGSSGSVRPSGSVGSSDEAESSGSRSPEPSVR